MDEGDGPMQAVLTLFGDLVDVDGVIVRANCEILLVRRINHDFTPLSGLVESGDSLCPVVVVQDSDISIVVADRQMVMLGGVCQASRLLLNWVASHG